MNLYFLQDLYVIACDRHNLHGLEALQVIFAIMGN